MHWLLLFDTARLLILCRSVAIAEFWQRYIAFLEACGDAAAAEDAVKRSTTRFCKARPEVHLAAAAFHERAGDAAAARIALRLVLDSLAPDSYEALMALVGLERRQGNQEAACQAFSERLEKAKDSDSHKSFAFLSIQYAQFLCQAFGDVAEGRKVRLNGVRSPRQVLITIAEPVAVFWLQGVMPPRQSQLLKPGSTYLQHSKIIAGHQPSSTETALDVCLTWAL